MTRSKSGAPGSNKRVLFPLVLKIWAALISLVLACLLVVYLCTIGFLENSYVSGKKNEVVSITEQAIREVLSYDRFDAANALADESLGELAMNNSVCIAVFSARGEEIGCYEGVGVNCYIHSSRVNLLRMAQAALDNLGQLVVNEIKHPQFDTRYFVCCRFFSKSGAELKGDTLSPQGLLDSYIVMVTAPLASVSEAANAIRAQMLYITVTLMIVATAIALLMAFWMTRPMKKLSQAAKAVASGDLDTVVEIRSHDEMGVCGENFNEMVRQINQSSVLQREMVANVSHDLRTPLTMIRGYAESIRDIVGEDKEARDRQLDIIIDETDRLSGLVRDIMDLSLLQAGKLKMAFGSFSAQNLMGKTLQRFAFLEENEGFKLDMKSSLPQIDCFVKGDQNRIEQVLYNFIGNAANHSKGNFPDGTPIPREILLTLSAGETPGTARISVIDKGEGIKKEDLSAIWERYYKPYRTAGGVNRGTGLGLSIVKAILTEHKAPFGVSSTLGKGSCFWFELPIETDVEKNAPDMDILIG